MPPRFRSGDILGALMTERAAAISPLKTAVRAKCPRCGGSPLFMQVINMREQCAACGLDYKFIDTGDGPAVFAILILGAVIAGLALFVEFTYLPPVWVHVLAWGLLTPLLALGLLRFLKALLIALQYRNKAEEGRLTE